MACIAYTTKTFSRSSLAVIDQANVVIDEYLAQGFRLTLRQLYYQFVSRDWLENTQQSYKRLGSIVADGRNAGLIDWEAIEDRTRNVRSQAHWETPSEILRACANQFCYDLWENQRIRIEVWIEKEALAGVFESVCDELDVSLFSCRGYTSQSEMWSAGQRLASYVSAGQTPMILHFGDHDPSGIDMTRDILDRLQLYSESDVEVHRLALNFDQIESFNLPPNPAKTTDSRYASYIMLHGTESWELDALEPPVLAALVREAISYHRDEEQWEAGVLKQEAARKKLRKLAKDWSE